ncbi:uncharacterized protein PAN0_015d5063 [Moesziomyces antarcticus]|uniref:Uncharacterized protein n=1 Tax=Pseudozyma antarctica TaxID=84753 RepID=A0A081CJJ3_PSEA2|nr:uncharacterized protein PAN0_015d5063 [Moesziomyces antarcticus]GAK66839.1 hypothetical protein PAN0_015d5063 [Moesziomyces antarcticus]
MPVRALDTSGSADRDQKTESVLSIGRAHLECDDRLVICDQALQEASVNAVAADLDSSDLGPNPAPLGASSASVTCVSINAVRLRRADHAVAANPSFVCVAVLGHSTHQPSGFASGPARAFHFGFHGLSSVRKSQRTIAAALLGGASTPPPCKAVDRQMHQQSPDCRGWMTGTGIRTPAALELRHCRLASARSEFAWRQLQSAAVYPVFEVSAICHLDIVERRHVKRPSRSLSSLFRTARSALAVGPSSAAPPFAPLWLCLVSPLSRALRRSKAKQLGWEKLSGSKTAAHPMRHSGELTARLPVFPTGCDGIGDERRAWPA